MIVLAAAGCAGLPRPPEPAADEVTGVVVTSGFFRVHASDGFNVVVAFPVEEMDEFWALLGGGSGEVPEEPPVIAAMTVEREPLGQIDGLVLAEVEDSVFTLRGLDPNKDYWFCAGNIDEEDPPDRVEPDVCDQPDVDIPGSITAWPGPQSPNITTYESP